MSLWEYHTQGSLYGVLRHPQGLSAKPPPTRSLLPASSAVKEDGPQWDQQPQLVSEEETTRATASPPGKQKIYSSRPGEF